IGPLGADIVEEGDGAAVSAVKEEMQEIRMIVRSPALGRNGMDQRQAQQIPIELHGFGKLPRGASGMVHTMQLDTGDIILMGLHVHLVSPSMTDERSLSLFRVCAIC